MKKRWIMLLATVMIFAFAVGAVAGPAVQSITASLANDFKFTLNGEAWTPMDRGAAMAPIVYNDRTYLPVRAVSEALGIRIDWDDATRTVILGEAAAPQEPVGETAVEPVGETAVEPVGETAVEPVAEAEFAVTPAGCDFNKNAPADISINITWGTATKVTEITGSALAGAVNITTTADEDYTVDDNGDGTAVLTIKQSVTGKLPVPIAAVPDGTVLTLTIKFDSGDQANFDVKVVS